MSKYPSGLAGDSDALNRYISIEVERRTWLCLPSGTFAPPAVTPFKKLKYL